MSVETLILRMSSESENSAPNSPVPDSAPSSAPFLAEEAYPLVLRSLLDIGLGDQICLSEDNIGEISRATSRALFTPNSVFSQFLVVPRVECAISVLLWRLRVTHTCGEGQSALDLPSIPIHVLASSLSGLLDNTKLYKGTKQHPVPVRRLALDPNRHLALPSPVTSTPVSTSPSPPRPAQPQTPMTPPDSVAGDSTPIASGLPTPKKSIKFRPPPIITRAASGRGPKSAGTGPVTLNFAAAALAEYHIEALDYHPAHTTESPDDKALSPSPSKLPPPSPSKLTHSKIPLTPSNLTSPRIPSRPASPTKSVRSRSRPPSPNPPRPPSPSKRLKKPPPGVKRSKSLTGKSKKTKDKEKEKEKEKDQEWRNDRPNSSMWTPAGVEAHYRNDSSVRTLGLAGRMPSSTSGVGENGEVSSTSGTSAVPTPSTSALGTPSASVLGTPSMRTLGTPTLSALGTPSASAIGTPSATPLLQGAVITPFEPEQVQVEEEETRTEEGPQAHIEVEAPTPCASPKPSVRLSARSIEDASSAFTKSMEESGVSPLTENGVSSGSRENLVTGSKERLGLSGSSENLGLSPSRENLALPASRDSSSSPSRDELVPPRTPSCRASPEIHAPVPSTPTQAKRVSIVSDPRTPSPSRSVFPGSSLHVLHSPDTVRSVYSQDPMRSAYSPDLLRSSDLLKSPASSMYRLSAMGSPSPRRDGSPVPRSILRNSLTGSPAPRNGSPAPGSVHHATFPSTIGHLAPDSIHRATSPPLHRATSPSLSRSESTRSRTISVSGASLIRSRTVSGASLVRNRTVSSSESTRRTSTDGISRMRTISDLGRTSEESSIRPSLEGSRRASIESARRASIESAQRARVESPRRTSLQTARRRRSSLDGHRMSVDVDGITIMAVSIADATPVTPTARRTGFNIDDERSPSRRPDSYLTPMRQASPGALSLGTGTPNAQLGISPGPSFHLSPGAMSLSTVPSLSPFPESDDGDFGFRDGEEDATVTAPGALRGKPSRSPSRRSPVRGNKSPVRNEDQSPVRPESPSKPKRRPLPPPPQGSPSRAAGLRALSPPLNGRGTPITGRGTPTRQLGSPTKQHPGMPPRSWTDSPSRASTSTHQTIGVPMTQVSSRPRTLSTQARPQNAESGVSESEAESLPFPGSTSTLSLPENVSLSEVSPFTAPKELEDSSGSERPSPWIGPGVTSSPWVDPRASSSSSGSPWMGDASIELLGGSGMLMNSSLPKLAESATPRASTETSRPKSKHSRSGSTVGHSRAGSTVGHELGGSVAGHEQNGSVTGRERSGSSSRPGSSIGHSRPGSTTGHSRVGSGTHPGLGLRSGQDILVPMVTSKTFSRSDVVKLVSRGDSFDSSRGGAISPVGTSSLGLGTVSEYSQPMPVFMVPGADPTKVSSVSRPKSMALLDETHAKVGSEDSDVSVVLNQDGEAMVRTTEVGVGAGRARVQTGVGVGVSRTRGGSVVKSKVDSGLRKRVDSGKSEPRTRADSTKSNEPRPRVNSAARPKIDSNLRGRVDSVRRKPVSSASHSPTTTSPASPTSTSTTSARRILIRKASSEAASRTRKSSNASLRKSSMSSLRSTPPTTVSSPSARKSTRTASSSSEASTPRSSTPRSSGAFSPRTRTTSGGGNTTPKAGTPRTSISSGRSSVTSPKSNLAKSSTTPKTNSGTTTPKAAPRPLPPRPGPVPPVRPQRSALRPGLRASVTIPPVPAQPSPATTTTPTISPTRTRAVTMDVKSTSPTESALPRRTTSISSKAPPVSRSGLSSSSASAAPLVKARLSNRTSLHTGTEQTSNDVPFPSPESRDSLQVPETPRLKRSLSVSSAARKLVGRTRAASPVPPNPSVDTNSLAQSTEASSIERSPQKAPRSLSRLAFSALLPRRSGNNAAAEAKAALAQAKAREVAGAKARAKAAAEEAKARAKAEAEEAKAARAAKAKEEKEAKKNSKRFGSLSKRGGHS